MTNRGLGRFACLWLMAALVSLLLVTGCSGESATNGGGGASGQSSVAQEGEESFNRTCAVCHGANAAGSQTGPSLVDPVYRPGHHPDISFRNAVKNGVISHHWNFGHMPPQPGVSEEEVEKIICYVRELQISEGIYEGEAC